MDEAANILEKDGSTHLADWSKNLTDFHFDHGLRRFQLSKEDFN